MTRSITTDQRNALAADGVVKVELIELAFTGGSMYLTTAGHDIDWDGHTWVGDGSLRSVSTLRENLALQAHGAQIELSGANPALVAIALNGTGRGKAVNIYVAPMNAETYKLVGTPVLETKLRIDTMTIIDGVDE